MIVQVIAFLGKATGCLQQSIKAIGWTLLKLGFVAGQKGSGERGRAVHLLILGDNGHVPSERVHQVLDG